MNVLKWLTCILSTNLSEEQHFLRCIQKGLYASSLLLRKEKHESVIVSLLALSWSESTNLHSLKNLAVWRVQCMQDKLNWIKGIKCKAELSDMMTWWH